MRWFPVLLIAALAGCSRQPQATPQPEARPAAAPRPDPYGEDFRRSWPDGQAEVAVYSFTPPGQRHGRGTAVALLLPGRMSPASRALLEPDSNSVTGAVPIMQFNLVRDYGGNLAGARSMLSVIMPMAPVDGMPAGGISRITSSVQTVGGQEWAELLLSKHSVVIDRRGDAAGMTGRKVLSSPNVLLPESALPLCARRIAWPRLRLGQRVQATLLEGVGRPEPAVVHLALSSTRHTAVAPAGSFRTHLFTASWRDGSVRKWYVETEPPHRIIRWEFSDGERGELLEWKTMPAADVRASAQALRP